LILVNLSPVFCQAPSNYPRAAKADASSGKDVRKT
jgi:hypothetical protein